MQPFFIDLLFIIFTALSSCSLNKAIIDQHFLFMFRQSRGLDVIGRCKLAPRLTLI